MRQHTEGKASSRSQGGTVQGVLDNLGTKYPRSPRNYSTTVKLRRFVNLYLNDEDIRYLDNLDTPGQGWR